MRINNLLWHFIGWFLVGVSAGIGKIQWDNRTSTERQESIVATKEVFPNSERGLSFPPHTNARRAQDQAEQCAPLRQQWRRKTQKNCCAARWKSKRRNSKQPGGSLPPSGSSRRRPPGRQGSQTQEYHHKERREKKRRSRTGREENGPRASRWGKPPAAKRSLRTRLAGPKAAPHKGPRRGRRSPDKNKKEEARRKK
eukprot:16437810-Heterocapsa_arctica.AAC.1